MKVFIMWSGERSKSDQPFSFYHGVDQYLCEHSQPVPALTPPGVHLLR